MIDGIFSGLSPLSRTSSRAQTPALQIPQLQQQPPQVSSIASETEDTSSAEMLTAREQTSEPKSAVLRTISYRTNVGTLSEEALKFQLFIRGVDVDDPEISLEGLRKKGEGRGKTVKAHYLELAQQMLNDGRWQTRVEEELLKKRINDYRKKNQARGSKD